MKILKVRKVDLTDEEWQKAEVVYKENWKFLKELNSKSSRYISVSENAPSSEKKGYEVFVHVDNSFKSRSISEFRSYVKYLEERLKECEKIEKELSKKGWVGEYSV